MCLVLNIEENRLVVFVVIEYICYLCLGFLLGRSLGGDLGCSQCEIMDKSLEHLEQLLDAEMESNHRLSKEELEARLKIHCLEKKIETLECSK